MPMREALGHILPGSREVDGAPMAMFEESHPGKQSDGASHRRQTHPKAAGDVRDADLPSALAERPDCLDIVFPSR